MFDYDSVVIVCFLCVFDRNVIVDFSAFFRGVFFRVNLLSLIIFMCLFVNFSVYICLYGDVLIVCMFCGVVCVFIFFCRFAFGLINFGDIIAMNFVCCFMFFVLLLCVFDCVNMYVDLVFVFKIISVCVVLMYVN